MMKLLLCCILLCLLPGSEDGDPIRQAQWLLGTWENKTARGSIYERWVQNEDNSMGATSFVIHEGDTIILEEVELRQENDSLFYVAIVRDQNSGEPVKFSTGMPSDEKLIFVNHKHDYPQMISYEPLGQDSLRAEISGMRQGQMHKSEFLMRRLK